MMIPWVYIGARFLRIRLVRRDGKLEVASCAPVEDQPGKEA